MLSHARRDKYAQVLNHRLDPDIMIFGPSTVLRHFSPPIIKEVTGLTSWNMGYDGMFFLEYNALIKEFLTYSQHCKYLIIGCNPYLGKDWIIMRPDFFYSFLGEQNVYSSLHNIDPQPMFLAKYLPGYKLTLLNRSYYWSMAYPPRKPDSLCGYEPITDTGHKFDDFIKPFNEPCDEFVLSELRQTVDKAVQKGMKVILVMPPIYYKGYKLILNAELIKSKYRSMAKDNVYFLDYSTDSISRSVENFQNYSHLNMTGATKFSYTFAHDFLRIINSK